MKFPQSSPTGAEVKLLGLCALQYFYLFRPSIAFHSPTRAPNLSARGQNQVPRCLTNFHRRQHTLRALKTHVGMIVPFGLGMLATDDLRWQQ